jgi:hypothetical protein
MAAMRGAWALGLTLVVGGCAGYHPPRTVASDRGPTAIRASFSKTWEALIDWTGKANLSVDVLDRTSGFISLREFPVGTSDTTWADCGRDAYGWIVPTQARLDIVAHGDSAGSTVRVNVVFANVERQRSLSCVTHGVLERDVERWIKQAAETGTLPPWRWSRGTG